LPIGEYFRKYIDSLISIKKEQPDGGMGEGKGTSVDDISMMI